MSPTQQHRPPRTVEDVGRAPRSPRAGERAAEAMSGVWGAVQGIVLSFAVVLLLTVVALLGSPGGEGTPWGAASRVAVGLWLLGHGVPVAVGGATVTLVPLGVGALAVFTTYVAAKRSAVPAVPALVGGAGVYVVTTTTLAALGGVAGPRLVLAALAGLVVGGTGVGAGILAQPDAPRLATLAARVPLPGTVRLGLRAGLLAVALLVAASAALVGVWCVAGRATGGDILATLAPGWIGGVVLAVAQLALVPNLVLWAAAWLAGPGFAVGEGTSFAPRGVVDGPLPAVPLLGALPGADWSGPGAAWAPVVVVACGAVAGWFAWRRLEPSLVGWPDVAAVVAGVVLAAGLLVALLEWWAGGAVGAGRLAVVGAHPLVTAALVAAEAGGGAAAVLAAGRTGIRGRLRVRRR